MRRAPAQLVLLAAFAALAFGAVAAIVAIRVLQTVLGGIAVLY
ncbi:MAG: hypothetical protein ACRDNM_04410 [Gaiellaceae bacterium]